MEVFLMGQIAATGIGIVCGDTHKELMPLPIWIPLLSQVLFITTYTQAGPNYCMRLKKHALWPFVQACISGVKIMSNIQR